MRLSVYIKIDKIGEKYQMVTRKEVFDELKASSKLPTPSEIALKILDLCHREDTSIAEIAKVIEADPALSAEVLKFANSSFLATGLKVASVKKAAVKLGINTVVHLALGFSLLTGNRDGNCIEFNYQRFWSLSLAQAIAARAIASYSTTFDPDEMFVCGLLSHVGQLALVTIFPDEYTTILINQPGKNDRKVLEKSLFSIDSDELTTELLIEWGLPGDYAYGAGFHEDLYRVKLGETTTKNVAELLSVANMIAELCQGLHVSKEWLEFLETQFMGLAVVTEGVATIFDLIVSQWQEWGDILNIHTPTCYPYEEIKAMSEGSG